MYRLALAAAAGLLLAADPAAGQFRTSPLAYPGGTEWVLDSKVSDLFTGGWFNPWRWYNAFYDADCTVAMMNQGQCTPQWHGMAPTLIQPGQLKQQDNQLQITLQQTDGSAAAFAAANGNVESPEGCDCNYQGLVTGLLRSRALVRGAYIEATLQMPASADVVGSVWLQGDNVEISAVALHGSTLSTAGYIFTANGTAEQALVSSEVPDPAAGMVTYGVEWRVNDDVIIHRNGQPVHTLAGAAWNPSGQHSGQQLNLMVDLQLAAGADAAAAAAAGLSATLRLDDLHVFEVDCTAAMQFEFAPWPSDPASSRELGISGVGTACQGGVYASQCVDYNRALCTNPAPGGAELTTWSDKGACAGITLAGYCGGVYDNRGSHPGADAQPWKAGRGTVGNCFWDWTATKTTVGGTPRGKCVGTSPVDLSRITDANQCGGNADAGVADMTRGYGMWCFNKCLRRTEFNAPGTKWWNNFCMGATDYDGVDMCSKIGRAGRVNTNAQGVQVWQSDWATCMARSDSDPDNRRSKHCYMKWKAEDESPTWDGHPKMRGMYCSSRNPTTSNPKLGGIPLWQYTPLGGDRCRAAGGAWVCMAKQGRNMMQCRALGTAGLSPSLCQAA